MEFARLLGFAKPYRWRLAGLTALMVLESVSLLALPWLAGLFASGVSERARVDLDQLALGVGALLAIQCALRVARGTMLANLSEEILSTLKKTLYNHLQALPISFLRARRRGELLAVLTHELPQLSAFISGTLLGILPAALMAAGAVVLMLRIDSTMAVAVAAALPAFLVTMKIVGRRLRPLSHDWRLAQASSLALAEENFLMLPAIKSFTAEVRESERHARHVDQLRDLGRKRGSIVATVGPVVQFVAAAAVLLLLWAAGDQVMTGEMSQGELVAFLLYAALLTRPVASLAEIWGQTQHTRDVLTHLDEVLRMSPEAGEEGLDPGAVKGEIRFENVEFAHVGRAPALFDVNLVIAPGETVALTGVNGAGKSTMVDLLLRFYSPHKGRIRLDGLDIALLNLNKLRKTIAVVPQEVLLFNGSIWENVRFGNPEASDAETLDAARNAQVDHFVAELPNGYHTPIGDEGVLLSGGQRQRIALARAFLKNPAILVLDEPTAQFDPDGEHRFVQLARRALENRTVILITHRPASLALADRVVVLDQGRIVADRAPSFEHQWAGELPPGIAQ